MASLSVIYNMLPTLTVFFHLPPPHLCKIGFFSGFFQNRFVVDEVLRLALIEKDAVSLRHVYQDEKTG